MAGGHGDHGGRRGQVPMEEAPHHDRSIEDVVLIEDLQRQIVELTLLLQRNSLLEVADRNQDRRMRHGSSRSKTHMSRDRRTRHESTSYIDISSHHRLHNIFSDNVSLSPHPQQRDNHLKVWNSLYCGAKAENLSVEDEEIFHDKSSLVSCDEEALHQHNTKENSREAEDHKTDSDSTFDNPFQDSGTNHSVFEVAEIFACENMSFDTPPIYDEYADDEDDISSNLEESLTEIESFEKDLVGDLVESSFSPSYTTNTSTKEVCSLSTTNVDLQQFQQKICLINIDVSRYEYEDPFFKRRSDTSNEGYSTFFRCCITGFHFSFDEITKPIIRLPICGLHNPILVPHDLMRFPYYLTVLVINLYCLKEVYKESNSRASSFQPGATDAGAKSENIFSG